MNNILILLVIFAVSCRSLSSSRTYNETLVSYYLELLSNRTNAAYEYEFPTDARMYIAADKKVRGKNK